MSGAIEYVIFPEDCGEAVTGVVPVDRIVVIEKHSHDHPEWSRILLTTGDHIETCETKEALLCKINNLAVEVAAAADRLNNPTIGEHLEALKARCRSHSR